MTDSEARLVQLLKDRSLSRFAAFPADYRLHS